MFNINDAHLIKKIIDTKTDDQIVMPLYIKIYNKTYSLLEMDDIEDYSPSVFKIGFGTCTSIFKHNKYIANHIMEFPLHKTFNVYNDELMVGVQYYMFETGYIDDISEMHKQINYYIDLIESHVADNVNKKKKEIIKRMIEENSVK